MAFLLGVGIIRFKISFRLVGREDNFAESLSSMTIPGDRQTKSSGNKTGILGGRSIA